MKPRTMLHITDGESVAGTLRQSAVPGEVRIFGDLMYEGPAPAGLTDAEWWDTRARFHSQCFDLTLAETGQAVRAFEESLNIIPRHDETVLWMDHRLSDQLILIMLLQRFYRLYCEKSSLSLICLGQYPGMENFPSDLANSRQNNLRRSLIPDLRSRKLNSPWQALPGTLSPPRFQRISSFFSPGTRPRSRSSHLPYVVIWSNCLLSKMAYRVPSSRRSPFFATGVRYLLCNSSSLFKKQSTLSSWETGPSSRFSENWHRQSSLSFAWRAMPDRLR